MTIVELSASIRVHNEKVRPMKRTGDLVLSGKKAAAAWLALANWTRLVLAFAITTTFPSTETLLAQPVPGTAPTKPLDPKELDGYFAGQLNHKPFVGISVALAQGGKITFCKGYGYASKEAKRPVDSET
jgi:CubicO group peptidase (beta-lactamase class C family)